MMKFVLGFFLCVVLSPNLLFADEQVTILEVEGFGISRNEAIQNGLIQALKQAKGVTIESQKTFAKSLREKSTSQDGNNSHQVEIHALSEGVVREITQGLINEYRVIDSQKISGGEWEVTLAVKMLRYKTPGISPHSRRKIAIIPFRTTKDSYDFRGGYIPSSEISRQFTQKLITEITQTRRFTVLDREYMEEFLREKNLVLSADAPVAEQMKIGEVLGVDYLLIGTISEANLKRTPYTIHVTGETGFDYSASFIADYRIMVMATRQIKWSDSVTLSLGDAELQRMSSSLRVDQLQQALLTKAAKEIIHRAMENIYPLRIVNIQENGEVILNQGGVTVKNGEILDVFTKGEKIIDPYTGESLGAAESWIAQIKITRVIPKMSYARIIKGELSTIKNGSICRRLANKRKPSLHPTGRTSDVKPTYGGGVVLPFD
jgi:curli biogenesis system outer membrane secretion channel CsgG